MLKIEKHLEEIEEGMSLLDQEEIENMVEVLRVVRKNRGTVYIFGNGGSMATASHFANDLSKMCRIRAVALGDMKALVSAWGNDTGWENMFYGPLSEMVNGKDALVGISCSGNSANVIRALQAGRDQWNVLCAGLTGMSNQSMMDTLEMDALIHTWGAADIRVQEDLHLMICHAVVREIQEGG